MFKNVRRFASEFSTFNEIKTNSNLSAYLAGLVEGDGSIAVHDPNSKAKKYRPMFIIVFKRSDLPLANYLCQLTGCGKVYDKPERGYVLWQIQEILGVFKMTILINGFMRTPKHEALCRVIDWFNDYIKNNLKSKLPATKEILSSLYLLEKKPLDNSAIDSNAWLAGFLDADGNFSIALSKRTKKHLDKVLPYMRLEIRQAYHRTSVNETFDKSSNNNNNNSSYYFIMSKIATYLDINLNSRERLRDGKIYSSFIITASSLNSLDTLREFLNRYPLLSSKYLDYLDWSEVIDLIKEKGNNNVPGGSWELASLKRKDFNKTRTTLTWKHLNNTYIDSRDNEINFSKRQLSTMHINSSRVNSKPQSRKLHTTRSSTYLKLEPNWISGFIDGFPKKGIKQFSSKRPSGCSNNLSLVVWGTNLLSSAGKGKITLQESNMIKLPPYQFSVIIGLLLSDAWLSFSKSTSKNTRLGFGQSGANGKYFWFVFFSLSHYCSSYPQARKRTRFGKENIELQFFTRALSCFTELHYLFYPAGIKVIPYDIYNLLNPIALAHLIMGDGTASHHGLVLCTDPYSVQDVVRLMNVLIVKYKIECTIRVHRENQYRIYIQQNSMTLLLKIVSPYMHSSMLFKLKSTLNTPKNRNKIEVLDVENNTTTVYDSMGEAAKNLKISQSGISQHLSRNKVKPYKSRYIFKKI